MKSYFKKEAAGILIASLWDCKQNLLLAVSCPYRSRDLTWRGQEIIHRNEENRVLALDTRSRGRNPVAIAPGTHLMTCNLRNLWVRAKDQPYQFLIFRISSSPVLFHDGFLVLAGFRVGLVGGAVVGVGVAAGEGEGDGVGVAVVVIDPDRFVAVPWGACIVNASA